MAGERDFEYTRADFDRLRKISSAHSGIQAPDEKYDMFYARLSKRLRALGFSRFSQYCDYLEQNPDQEFTNFINSVTTNLTAFFREMHHFDYLGKELVPYLLEHRKSRKQINVWSAGCSTGEEPYSIAMTLREHIPSHLGWNISILATDLDSNVLETAANGIYSMDRIKGVSDQRLKKWFLRGKNSKSGLVRVKDELRNLIEFRQLNLMHAWPMKEQFDIIFCRNVIIYFDKPTKLNLINRYADLLTSDGHLFLGHSEALHRDVDRFKLIGKTIYEKAK